MGRQSTIESRRTAAVSNVGSPFGQNEWLVEEMYRKFRDDPSSVDPSWHEFLVDYIPETTETAAPAPEATPAAPAAKPAPAAAPAQPASPNAGNGAAAPPPAAPAPARAAAVPPA